MPSTSTPWSRHVVVVTVIVICIILNAAFLVWVLDPDVDLILSTTDQYRIQRLLQTSHKNDQGVSLVNVNANSISTRDPLDHIIEDLSASSYVEMSGNSVECISDGKKYQLNSSGLTTELEGVVYGAVLYGTYVGNTVTLDISNTSKVSLQAHSMHNQDNDNELEFLDSDGNYLFDKGTEQPYSPLIATDKNIDIYLVTDINNNNAPQATQGTIVLYTTSNKVSVNASNTSLFQISLFR